MSSVTNKILKYNSVFLESKSINNKSIIFVIDFILNMCAYIEIIFALYSIENCNYFTFA